MLQLDVLKAKYGDSLLLQATDNGKTVRILIDGGPKATFKQALKPRLADLSREAFAGATPVIDLAMISHIDMDHIGGMVKLLQYEKEAVGGEHGSIVRIRDLWHNSFFDLGGAAVVETGVRESAVSAASTAQEMFRAIVSDPHSDFGVVMAGVREGNQISELARFHRIPVNRGFAARLVTQGVLADDFKPLKLHVLGPNQTEVDRLRQEWAEYMEKLRQKEADVREAAMTLDTSVANLSSIVILAEQDDRRVLLTGDARGDFVVNALKDTGWVKDGVCHVDIFKWPHHGSIKNFPEGVFRTIIADHHVISADGRHDNPDVATIERFIDEHTPSQRTTLHMTYATNELRKSEHGREIQQRLDEAIDSGHQIVVNTPLPSKPWLTVDLP